MTNFICGTVEYFDTGSKAALIRAKRNLKRYFAAVACMGFRRSETFLEILKKRPPSFFIRERKKLHALKQNNKAHPMVDPEVLEIIRTRIKRI